MATPQQPHVNIAGDYSNKGVEIAPGDVPLNDFEDEADELGEMRDIAPRGPLGGVTKQMAENERATRESIKASTAGQSTLGQNAGKRLVNPSGEADVNTDWPVDE